MSKKQLTKKQHFIPRVYLKAWVKEWIKGDKEKIKIKNKSNDCEEYRSADGKSICWESNFYEEDKKNPNNEAENWLSEFENKFTIKVNDEFTHPHEIIDRFCFMLSNNNIIYNEKYDQEETERKKFDDILNKKSNKTNEIDYDFKRRSYVFMMSYMAFYEYLSATNQFDIFKQLITKLKEFISIQYIRTPLALERLCKQLSLEVDTITPFEMIKFFQQSALKNRINNLIIHAFYIPHNLRPTYRFHTNDNPCLDYQVNSELSTYFGSQIGDDDVFIIMPLSPSVLIVLTSKDSVFKTVTYDAPLSVTVLNETNVEKFVTEHNQHIRETANEIIIL